jgi:nitroreductase
MKDHSQSPAAHPAALDFLLTRRSRPAKTLDAPVPGDRELRLLLTAAARCPDHGKLEPWRFVVIRKGAMARLADSAEARGRQLDLDEEKIGKGRSQFDQGNLAVAVIEVQKPSEKVPPIEQTYSAGAVCLSLLNAALAAGWGANWLSGWPSHDRSWMRDALGLADNERIVGFLHIGTARSEPPDRPRPDIEAITRWIDE